MQEGEGERICILQVDRPTFSTLQYFEIKNVLLYNFMYNK